MRACDSLHHRNLQPVIFQKAEDFLLPCCCRHFLPNIANKHIAQNKIAQLKGENRGGLKLTAARENRVWTRQHQAVLDKLNRDGINRVKARYISAKLDTCARATQRGYKAPCLKSCTHERLSSNFHQQENTGH